MKIKTLVVLVGILVVLCAYIFFIERHIPDTDKKRAMQKRLLRFKSGSIVSLELRNEHGLFLLRKQQNGRWYFQNLSHVRADNREIQAVLSDMEYLEFERELDDEQTDLNSIGLSNTLPNLVMVGNDAEYQIYFGKDTPLGNNMYVLCQSPDRRGVYVVDGYIREKMDKTLFDLRSKKLIAELNYLSDKIIISRDSMDITLAVTDHTWKIVSPVKRRADQQRVRQITAAFENAQAVQFVDDSPNPDLSPYGLDLPRMTIRLEHDNDISALYIGKPYDNAQRYYVKNNYEPNVYGVEAKSMRLFFSSLFELSSKNIFLTDTEEIKSVNFYLTGASFTIDSSTGKWWITKPVRLKADSMKIERIFKEMRSCQIREYIVDRLAKEAVIEKCSENKKEIELFLYKDNDTPVLFSFYFDADNIYAMRDNDSDLWMVDINDKSVFYNNLLELADKNILDINRYTLNKLSLRAGAEKTDIVLRSDTWFRGDTPLLADDIQIILDRLQVLAVNDVYSLSNNEALNACGLTEPSMQINMSFLEGEDNSSREVTLLLGKEENGLFYACKQGYPLVFTMDRAAVLSLIEAIGADNKETVEE